MATSSIYADFKINDRKSANRFVRAIQNDNVSARKETSKVRYITDKKEIAKIFK